MFTVKATLCLAVLCSGVAAGAQGFSVAASIQMTRFSASVDGTSNDAIFSPDGRYAVVVTSRGLISSNQIESTIWIFDSEALKLFVNTQADGHAPTPRPLAKYEGDPNERTYGAYKGVISDVRWSHDSKLLYYLGSDNRRIQHLFAIGVEEKAPRQLSGADQDIHDYALSNGTVVYTGVQHSGNDASRVPYESDEAKGAVALTGMALDSILFPKQGTLPEEHTLWVVRGHQSPRRISAGSFLALDSSAQVLSLSPDGKYVVELLPRTERIPQNWSQYAPAPQTQDWRIDPSDPHSTSPANIIALKRYAIISLDTSKVSILDAPMAESLGYGDGLMARWSSDSRRLLVTNTFLPIEDGAPANGNRYPCTAVTMDSVARNLACISWNRYQVTPSLFRLANASFKSLGDLVQLSFAKSDGGTQREQYRWDNHGWIPSKSDENADDSTLVDHSNGLTLSVKEDLNSPPALIVTDLGTKRTRKLWDPNPQFGHMHLGAGAVYHWKDSSGFVWTGGLIKPVGYAPGTRYPLVIQTHGFRPSEFMTDGQFPTAMAARALASVGIMVLQVGTHNEHLRSYQEVIDQIIGYKAAIDQLNTEGLIDLSRVGIIGFSRTSWYVESALIDLPKLFKAATLADGIDESYVQYILDGPDYPLFTEEFNAINGGSPFGNGLEQWTRTAPSFHTDKIKVPIRIEAIGGPSSILQEWEIYASLRLQDKPVDLIYLPHGEHILQAPLDRLASQQGNVDWFRFWLQGYEDPDPTKREQYKRWEHLKDLHEADLASEAKSSQTESRR